MSHHALLRLQGREGARWQNPVAWLEDPASRTRQPSPRGRSIAWVPSLLRKGAAPLRRSHLCWREPSARPARLHLVVLDTSGSMRRKGQLALAKGHAAMLIEQAARAGDDVALLSFGGQGVHLLLPPRPARRRGAALIRPLGGGGGTPLAQALAQAQALLLRAARGGSHPAGSRTCLWLLTDGRTLEQPPAPAGTERIVIVDFDQAPARLGRCLEWAAHWGAEYRKPIEHLEP
ncbi:MAG: VWA domain-containing protein [Betaproteobacteria bacterium]|jgi:magnesium chelatase subunit ChlD-like protein|nr:VWA domain-containing protein [Betaproteobacteria bacterium]